jgi:hypothetical protein
MRLQMHASSKFPVHGNVHIKNKLQQHITVPHVMIKNHAQVNSQ